jgi:hypothetical protein
VIAMPLKSKQSKTPEERRVSNFSELKRDSIANTKDNLHRNGANQTDMDMVGKYARADSIHKPAERKMSEEAGKNKPRVEKDVTAGRSMQRKGAIADEHTHKLLASEAVVTETLRVSGLGFE